MAENTAGVPLPNANFVIQASVRPPGGPFAAATTLSQVPKFSGDSATEPDVAINAGGDVAVSWHWDDAESGTESIQASIRSGDNAFFGPVPASPRDDDCARRRRRGD